MIKKTFLVLVLVIGFNNIVYSEEKNVMNLKNFQWII